MDYKTGAGDAHASEESLEYGRLLALEDMESLLEELEDRGLTGVEGTAAVPPGLRSRMAGYGAHDVQQLRDKIMHTHAELDATDMDLTISES